MRNDLPDWVHDAVGSLIFGFFYAAGQFIAERLLERIYAAFNKPKPKPRRRRPKEEPLD